MSKRVWIDYSRVREALSFETVLNHYGFEYPSEKAQIKVICPFHSEETASCSINVSDGKFKCFGCNAKGNHLEFAVMMEGLDPNNKDELHRGTVVVIEAILDRDVVEFAKPQNAAPKARAPKGSKSAAKAPEKTSKTLSQVKAKKREEDEPEKPNEELEPNPVLDIELNLEPEHPFLAERKISPELAKRWGMGFCKHGIMRGRIAIPIHDENGGLVAYAGRWAKEDVPEDTPRYKLPKNFRKQVVVYNLHRAVALKNHKPYVVVVEGFWSVLRLHEAGIAAVSLLGTTCSNYQAKLIRKAGFKYAIVMLDGDDVGKVATPSVVTALAHHLYVRSVELPEGVKPDTMSEDMLQELR